MLHFWWNRSSCWTRRLRRRSNRHRHRRRPAAAAAVAAAAAAPGGSAASRSCRRSPWGADSATPTALSPPTSDAHRSAQVPFNLLHLTSPFIFQQWTYSFHLKRKYLPTMPCDTAWLLSPFSPFSIHAHSASIPFDNYRIAVMHWSNAIRARLTVI